MLNTIKSLKGYKLDSLDGEMGSVQEFYFDDQHWTIRYLVAETGNWLIGRQVLISPFALVDVVRDARKIIINLNKSQIENSPSLLSDQPVSKHFEESYYSYYAWPEYWSGPFLWGAYPYPTRDPHEQKLLNQKHKPWDPHLRSTRNVTGYHLQSEDGSIGHVEDFIMDDITWSIRYLIVDTQNWWPGKKILISIKWIERISWSEEKVLVKLSRNAIQGAPEYHEQALLHREYETALHDHYRLPEYWLPEPNTYETL